MFFSNRFYKWDCAWTGHRGWLVAALVLLTGCSNMLKPDSEYAVYYYTPMNKTVSIEDLNPPHTRKAYKPAGNEPALPALCDPTFPTQPQGCQGNTCSVDPQATFAVYYGKGEAGGTVKAVGVEKGPFIGRMINWPSGSGCAPACTRQCCAPSGGGCICLC